MIDQQSRPTESPSATGPVPLNTLRRGQTAIFCRADLPSEECELLCAMGLTDACHLKVCRSGQPCIVQIHATRLGISSEMTRAILVSPTVSAVPAHVPHCDRKAASGRPR